MVRCLQGRAPVPDAAQPRRHGADLRHRLAEKDPESGPAWLARLGDPYRLVGDDPNSRAAIALGVSGAPETFVIDRDGIIRHKHVGAVTPEVWEKELWPIVRALQAR